MKKIILISLISTFQFVFLSAQTPGELLIINTKSKNQFVKPEMLDLLMIALKKHDTAQLRTEDSLLLDTYKNISSAYMANNHFKQAYNVYSMYIRRKEQMLSADKANSIREAINSVSLRQGENDKEEKNLTAELNQLSEDNESLSVKQVSFKSNFSLALIILTAIFAIMLVSAGIKKMSLRAKLQQNRDRMKSIHRSAVIGNFSSGLRTTIQTVLITSKEQTSELHEILKKQEQNFPPVKQANQIITGIEKNFEEVPDTF